MDGFLREITGIIWVIFIVALFYSIVLIMAAKREKVLEDGDFFRITIALGISLLMGLILSYSYRDFIKRQCQKIPGYYSQTEVLEHKIKEISNLRSELLIKKEEVETLQDDYQTDIGNFQLEILNEKARQGITTYDQAKANTLIFYDLSLIQRNQAYMVKLEEVKSRLDTGANELLYLEREAESDLKLMNVLGKKQIDDLVSNINSQLKKYLPEAGKLAVEADPRSMQSPEQIWEQINQRR